LSRSIPKGLIDMAVRFHGHLGAFMVLGLKAGLLAEEVLGRDNFGTKAIVETKPFLPFTCFVDGVQVATCCTMGKGNIKLRKGDNLSVIFTRGCKRLKLSLKKEVLENLRKLSTMAESEKEAITLINRPTQELFDIEG